MGTPFSNTQQRSHTMKFFAVIPAILAAAAAEAQLPIAAQYIGAAGLYNGAYGYAAPYAAAYAAPAATAVDAKFAYGAPVTALNAGPLTAGPVAAQLLLLLPLLLELSMLLLTPQLSLLFQLLLPPPLLPLLLAPSALSSRLKMSSATLLTDTRTLTLPSRNKETLTEE